MVISVSRKARRSEKLLRTTMIVFAVFFLLLGIFLGSAFMLPCFLMAIAYYVYQAASQREWEYTLEEDHLVIERVSERGRTREHSIDLKEIEALSRPDDPAVAKYRRGGGVKLRKYDYTSYREDVPYYTMICNEDGQKIKLLLDLTPEAIAQIRHVNRAAVLLPPQ